jgi:hypothetical protein
VHIAGGAAGGKGPSPQGYEACSMSFLVLHKTRNFLMREVESRILSLLEPLQLGRCTSAGGQGFLLSCGLDAPYLCASPL